jgi:hypothetical protein
VQIYYAKYCEATYSYGVAGCHFIWEAVMKQLEVENESNNQVNGRKNARKHVCFVE